MKKYLGLLKYILIFKKNIFLYLATIVASIIFSIVSIAMLFPFLEIIFNTKSAVVAKPVFEFSSTFFLGYLKYIIGQVITEHSAVFALGAVCIFIVVAIFLKNLFLYFSYVVLTPLRNGVGAHIRDDLFGKILSLPIGYFTEQKKEI
jgi:ATP-binding cassette, subfamily B, bacterial MsbA